ncbi:MAG: hypothetical protein ACJAS4_000013 [Bacteriovoracaceae bacterium]|jgi:hypothetical protein
MVVILEYRSATLDQIDDVYSDIVKGAKFGHFNNLYFESKTIYSSCHDEEGADFHID